MSRYDRHAQLSRILYRGILRWAYANSSEPVPAVTLQHAHIAAVLPELALRNVQLPEDIGVAVRYLARLGFESANHVSSSSDHDRVDAGIDALRLLNTRYYDSIQAMKAVREEKAGIMEREEVQFKIGSVFKHRKYGYRGIIYGFDGSCERDDEWMRQMNISNRYQPFYYALPDESDAVRLLGGVRLTKYVAEENIIPLSGHGDKQGHQQDRIVHRALENYFVGYSDSHKRYVPSKRLRYEYPDDDYTDMIANMIPLDGSQSNILNMPDNDHDDEHHEEQQRQSD